MRLSSGQKLRLTWEDDDIIPFQKTAKTENYQAYVWKARDGSGDYRWEVWHIEGVSAVAKGCASGIARAKKEAETMVLDVLINAQKG